MASAAIAIVSSIGENRNYPCDLCETPRKFATAKRSQEETTIALNEDQLLLVIAYMKPQIFLLMGALLMTACHRRRDAEVSDHNSQDARTHDEVGGQEAIASEIIAIQHAFGDALFHLDNKSADNFVVKVNALSARLDKIAPELDRTGPFSDNLREATFKRLDDDERAFADMNKTKTKTPLRPSIAEITNPAVDRYFSASGSVMSKAGLLIAANGNSSVKPSEFKMSPESSTNSNTAR